MALVPAGVVTVMLQRPCARWRDSRLSLFFESLKLLAGVVPKWTAVTPVRFVPVIVTLVPPFVGPLAA